MKLSSCLIFILLLSGCSLTNKANRKLKRAEKLIAQAEQLGVKWHTDTVKTTFKFDGAKANFNFNTFLKRDAFSWQKPFIKDTTIYINDIKIEKKDSLIYIQCPDVEGEVATSVTKEIKTGLSALIVVQWSILALLVGAVLSRIFWK